MSDAAAPSRTESKREVDLFQALNSASMALFDIKEMASLLLDQGDLDKKEVARWNEAAVSMICARAESIHEEIKGIL